MQKLLVPIAIVLAGIAVAGALLYVNTPSDNNIVYRAPDTIDNTEEPNGSIRPVASSDHILGSPNATLVVIEYADLECPNCKNFHYTMQRIMDEHGKEGEVAWVYRHLPLATLHSQSPKEAEASECAAEIGGNKAFWDYIDRVFEVTPSNNGLELNLLPSIAEEIGLNRSQFINCLSSGRHQDSVARDFDEAIAANMTATPYIIISAVDGSETLIRGERPYAEFKGIIESLLVEKTPLF